VPIGGQAQHVGGDLRPVSSRSTTGMFTVCPETLLIATPCGAIGIIERQDVAVGVRLSSGTTASWPLGLYRKITNPPMLPLVVSCASQWSATDPSRSRALHNEHGFPRSGLINGGGHRRGSAPGLRIRKRYGQRIPVVGENFRWPALRPRRVYQHERGLQPLPVAMCAIEPRGPDAGQGRIVVSVVVRPSA